MDQELEFVDRDLSGSRFERVDLSRAWLRNVYLEGARIRGGWLVDVDIDGEVRGLVVNGVDVTAFVAEELDRRHPERRLMRPTDPDGYREAWVVLERLWSETLDRAGELPPAQLHERVDDEWSFVETVRHLLFVVDAWVSRALLDDPAPYHPWGLPHDEMEPDPAVPEPADVRPSLAEVRPLLEGRMAVVRAELDGLTDSGLEGRTNELPEPGYPPAGAYDVRRCLGAVVNEFWHHRLFAERDLAVLAQRQPGYRPGMSAQEKMSQHDHERDDERVSGRSDLLPEEQAAGSDDPEAQAEAILEESDERTDDPEGTRHESTQTPDEDAGEWHS